jgi:hypothetical protein
VKCTESFGIIGEQGDKLQGIEVVDQIKIMI